jgi:hypothetical protein
MKTLLITAAASAAAAYTCSKIWAPGTLAAAAFTPVLVAILKEALAKSSDVVARAVPPVKGVVRSALPGQSGASAPTSGDVAEVGGPSLPVAGSAPLEGRPRNDPAAPTRLAVGSAGSAPLSQVDPANPATWVASPGAVPAGAFASGELDLGDPAGRVPQVGEVSYHGTSARGRGWRLAIVTGLLGFLVGAVIITVPELVAGGSAAGNGRETTIFGGNTHTRGTPATTTTKTVTTVTTPTQTVTAPPAKTVTVPAPAPVTTTPPVKPKTATTQQAPAQTTTVAPTTTEPVVPEPSVAQPPG